MDQQQLREVGEWLLRIAAEGEEPPAAFRPAIPLPTHERLPKDVNDTLYFVSLAKEEYDDRTRRLAYFSADLLGEPAWDILLDLFVCYAMGRQISVTSACIASKVPVTTALRWIKELEDRGLLAREGDNTDARRIWVTLTAQGSRSMKAYLEARARQRRVGGAFFPAKIPRRTE